MITFTSSSAAMDGPTFKQTTNKHTNQRANPARTGTARVAARTAAPKHRAVRQAAAVGAESVKSARRVTAQRRGRRWGRRHLLTLTPIGLAMPRKYSMCAPSSRTSGVRLFAPMPFLPPFPSRTAAPHRSGRADARPSAVAWTGTSVVPFAVAWSLRLRASASHALRCAGQCKPWARAARTAAGSMRRRCCGWRCTLVLRTTDTYRTQRTTHAAHSNGDNSARHTARSVPPQRSALCFALRSGACGRRSRGSARRGCTTCSPPAPARQRRLHAAHDMLRTAGRRHHSGPWRAFIGAGAPRVPRILREYTRVRHPPCG